MKKTKAKRALAARASHEDMADMFCDPDYIDWLSSPVKPKAPPPSVEAPAAPLSRGREGGK